LKNLYIQFSTKIRIPSLILISYYWLFKTDKMVSDFRSKNSKNTTLTVAFYNLENLFDTEDDPFTLDDDFTPKGKNRWLHKRYLKKIKKLGSVISQLGKENSVHPPAIIGVVEVENEQVLLDLVQSKNLKDHHYGIVHYDSPDERGIDVALLYKKELFEYLKAETFPLYLVDKKGSRDYTRDVLWVQGNLNGELINVLVNHWPSRRGGQLETEEKRIKAAQLNHHIIDRIKAEDPESKMIIMGDFNDDPTSKSVKNYLVNKQFYNPMEGLLKGGRGSLHHEKTWHLFDQIIFSKNFFERNPQSLSFKYANIFDKHFLKSWKGKRKGNPFRTYLGKWYQGGFSDHFPVYISLSKN